MAAIEEEHAVGPAERLCAPRVDRGRRIRLFEKLEASVAGFIRALDARKP